MFIVIEGDNGTGKTTVGALLEKHGFCVVTDEPAVKAKEQQSKRFAVASIERVSSFVDYNVLCGNESKVHKNSVLVRYWCSTVAAAYADKVYSFAEAIELADKCVMELPRPDYIFRLRCHQAIRVHRIKSRLSIGGDLSDDISDSREGRYDFILDYLGSRLEHFVDLDSSGRSPEELVAKIMEITSEKNG